MSKRIGILGAGQLGRMLALAGYPLGLSFRFFDPTGDAPAGQLAEQHRAQFDDEPALLKFAAGLELVTYEFENVPADTLRKLERVVRVNPGVKALEASQDRVSEKSLCAKLGIPTAKFAPVNSESELHTALGSFGYPAVLKTRRMGYDGKGQAVIKSNADAEQAWRTLGSSPLILESFVNFERELSIIAARTASGAISFYPLVENHHSGGILRTSICPAPASTPLLESQAQVISAEILRALEYVGVLAIELFCVGSTLVFNEMAPRVHNSGHWTIEGAQTSQFENHLRAVADMPLGATNTRGVSCMLNFIGAIPSTAELLKISDCHLHLYGKSPRPGRKVGHCTIVALNEAELREKMARARRLIVDVG